MEGLKKNSEPKTFKYMYSRSCFCVFYNYSYVFKPFNKEPENLNLKDNNVIDRLQVVS